MSDQYGAQKECEVWKWTEGLIYVGITFHILVHRIISTLVQIILINIDRKVLELNPYNRCVSNKMVNGKRCNIVWYVD